MIDPLSGSIWYRFWKWVDVLPSGCWEWTGHTNGRGYGVLHAEQRLRYVHRLSYEWFVDFIPKGQVIDHLCGTPLCVNPDHLEVTSRGVNALRGRGRHQKGTWETHCFAGHELTSETVGSWSSGKRYCRKCQRERQLAQKVQRS